MDRNFARALKLVLQSEGGWSDDPRDSGGATMRGITLATFRAFIKPNGSKADLRAISEEQVATCYRKQYWDKVAGDELPDGVDYAVFDYGVNSGVGRAARYLQSVVGAPMDGTIGPATLDAVAKLPVGVVIDRLCDARLAFLKSLGTWGTFGKGWSSRVASVRKEAILMTAQPAPPTSPAPPVIAPNPSIPAASDPKTPPPVITKNPVGKHVGAGLGAIGLVTALITYWHDLIAWVRAWF